MKEASGKKAGSDGEEMGSFGKKAGSGGKQQDASTMKTAARRCD
jgi:hypothetical protein